MFCRKGVPRNSAKFTGKHLFQNPLFNKVAGLRLKKRDSATGVFLWIFVKFLRTPFLQNTSGWLLLLLDKIHIVVFAYTRSISTDQKFSLKIRNADVCTWNFLELLAKILQINLFKKYFFEIDWVNFGCSWECVAQYHNALMERVLIKFSISTVDSKNRISVKNYFAMKTISFLSINTMNNIVNTV